jgi:hypothetical protein
VNTNEARDRICRAIEHAAYPQTLGPESRARLVSDLGELLRAWDSGDAFVAFVEAKRDARTDATGREWLTRFLGNVRKACAM